MPREEKGMLAILFKSKERNGNLDAVSEAWSRN